MGNLAKAMMICLPSHVKGLFLSFMPPSTYSTNCFSLGCSSVCGLSMDARRTMNSSKRSSTTAYSTRCEFSAVGA